MKFEFGRDVEVPLSPCPTCGHQMDRERIALGSGVGRRLPEHEAIRMTKILSQVPMV
jgi:hypothetical protein